MVLIIGLGNPGARYLLTRHNLGFMAVHHFLISCGNPPMREKFQSVISQFKLDGNDVMFALPQTYMNLSGVAVKTIMEYFKIEQDKLLVIHDDVDQEFGLIKFQKDRGDGGHKGIRSIHDSLGTQDYARLKLGVGRPQIPEMDVSDYVLQEFSGEEKKSIPAILEKSADAIESFLVDGFEKSINRFNRRD